MDASGENAQRQKEKLDGQMRDVNVVKIMKEFIQPESLVIEAEGLEGFWCFVASMRTYICPVRRQGNGGASWAFDIG